MRINNINNSPIPPSGITRISLWKHGMERPAMVSPAEFRIDVGLMLNNKSALYDHITEPNKLRKTLFNFSFETTTAGFGYVPAFKGEHDTIVCPSKEEKPFKGLIFPFGDIPTIMLTHEDRSVFSGSTEEQDLFNGFVTMARFLVENLFPQQSYLDYGTTLDLDMLNQSTNNLLFKGSIKTLGDLARQALPQDADLNNVLSFPAPPVFEHCENHPDKKCSFGFNILHPAKFPYPAQAVSIAIRTFLGSRSWDPKKIDTVLEPLKLPSKDGERVIHITAKEISGSRTELSFCIRRPLEHESTAPIKGRIIFRE